MWKATTVVDVRDAVKRASSTLNNSRSPALLVLGREHGSI